MFQHIDDKKLFSYIRITSNSYKQNLYLEFQKKQLLQQGLPQENFIIEICPSVKDFNELSSKSPLLFDLIENKLKIGDYLIVTSIDRCSRNIHNHLLLETELFNKGVNLISLDLPIALDRTINRIMLEMHRDFIVSGYYDQIEKELGTPSGFVWEEFVDED